MGRIKELLEKVADKSITAEEKAELDELQKEAADATPPADPAPAGDEDDEEKAVSDLADKLTEKVTASVQAGFESRMDKVLKAVEDRVPDIKVGHSNFIVDKRYGKKTVEELDEIKVDIEGRKDKKHQQLSLRSLHFIEAMATGNVEKLQVLVEGTGARGGFLVPDDYANMIVEDIRDRSIMRQIADVMTTTSDTLHLPNLSSRPRAAFRSEGAVKSTSTVDFGETVFTPYSLAAIVALSNELVADASLGVNGSIVNYVTQLIVQALQEREERAFWTGSGSGEPTGVETYTLGAVAAAATDVGRADAVISTFMRLGQGYRNRGVWVGNSGTIEKVQSLKDSQNNYLVSRLTDSPVFTLKGRPVYEQNDIEGGKLFFGDFSYYKIVDREGVQIRISDEATVAGQSAFERNLTYVRVEKRVDGELTLTGAIREVTGLGTP